MIHHIFFETGNTNEMISILGRRRRGREKKREKKKRIK
jgi:hypothetical protein